VYTEVQNRSSFFNPKLTNPVAGNLGALQFAGNASSPAYCNCSTPVNPWYKNFWPRIGLAYSVTPRINVTNSVIFGAPPVSTGTPSTFGKVTSQANNSRDIRLDFRLNFQPYLLDDDEIPDWHYLLLQAPSLFAQRQDKSRNAAMMH
jgi:hypothetical protein